MTDLEKRLLKRSKELARAADKLIASWKGFECPICGAVDDCKPGCPWTAIVVASTNMDAALAELDIAEIRGR